MVKNSIHRSENLIIQVGKTNCHYLLSNCLPKTLTIIIINIIINYYVLLSLRSLN